MKRLAILMGLLVMPAILLGVGDPANNSQSQTTSTFTVDSQWTGVWAVVDSMIVIVDDTAFTFYHVSATALIKPGQRLYYGIKDGAAAVIDTHILQLPGDADSAETVEIGVSYIDSTVDENTFNDSIQFVCAVSGSSNAERVLLTNIRITGTITAGTQ